MAMLAPLSSALDHVYDGWNILSNGAGALSDWLFNINRWRVLSLARRRFPREFARLDGGDIQITRSFLDPDPISNTVSLLGMDPRVIFAPLCVLGANSWARKFLNKLNADLDAEFYFDDFESLHASAQDSLGPDARYSTPFVEKQAHSEDDDERWFFINGIATTRDLARKNAAKLSKLLNRCFITIYNPTQGLSDDLVESAVQKFTNVNTEPTAAAFIEIAEALADPHVKRVVVVAHSQGTIIAGDVLDLIYFALDPVGKRHLDKTNMNSEDFRAFLHVSHGVLKSDDLRKAVTDLTKLEDNANQVAKKLELYMFANAASRMCYLDADKQLPVIESFANEHDCVARLGCLAEDKFHEQGLIRIDGPVFSGRGRYGHLLNAHYLSGDLQTAYQLLPKDGAAPPPPPTAAANVVPKKAPPSVGGSLHDKVDGNPCARNPKAKAVTAPGKQSRFLNMLVSSASLPRPKDVGKAA